MTERTLRIGPAGLQISTLKVVDSFSGLKLQPREFDGQFSYSAVKSHQGW